MQKTRRHKIVGQIFGFRISGIARGHPYEMMRDGAIPQASVEGPMVQQLSSSEQKILRFSKIRDDYDRFGERPGEILRNGRLLLPTHVGPELHDPSPRLLEREEVREITQETLGGLHIVWDARNRSGQGAQV